MDNNIQYFNYLYLNEIFNKFYNNGVDNVDISLLISLEKEYYEGKNFKLIMSDLRKLMKNKEIICDINGKKEKFKINKLSLQVGDVLNRHMFYYRHCADYFKKHNVDREELIPEEIKQEFESISYEEGKQEGKDWFKDNIDAINLFSDDKVLTKDFFIGDDITTIFEETEETPKLEYICYEHWLKHPRYDKINKTIIDICNNKDCSFVDRCYTYEAECFYNRLAKRNEAPEFRNLFIQQSKKYLIDETAPSTIENSTNTPNNYTEIYYHGLVASHYLVFLSRHAKNNKIVKESVDTVLSGIKNYTQITIKEQDYYNYF